MGRENNMSKNFNTVYGKFDLETLMTKQDQLLNFIPHGHMIPNHAIATTIACMGFIEEIYEILEARGFRSWRLTTDHDPDNVYGKPKPTEDREEETADSLFFYLEIMLFQGFSEADVMSAISVLMTEQTKRELECESFAKLCEYFDPAFATLAGKDSRIFINDSMEYDEYRQVYIDLSTSLVIRTMVFMNTIGFKSWRPDRLSKEKQLEEFAKMTILYAQLLILNISSLDNLVAEYDKKWEINKQRWAKANEGNFDWDHRDTKESL